MKKEIAITCFSGLMFLLSVMDSSALSGNPLEIVDTNSFKQEQTDSTTVKKEKVFKNTVRYNVTNTLIFSDKTLIFGYERVLGKHQSVSIDFGPLSLPKLSIINTDNFANVSGSSTEKGFHVSADYRFYLGSENKYDAPRGIYLAPFASINYFERKNTWTLNSATFQGDVNTNFKLQVLSAGGELGYQFILWKRFAIDLILIGPGMANYSIKASVNTTLSAEDQSELFKLIHDALADKIPGYDLVIDDMEFEKSGSTNTTSFGFRYMINLGFRF
jgi:hypothetical protein